MNKSKIIKEYILFAIENDFPTENFWRGFRQIISVEKINWKYIINYEEDIVFKIVEYPVSVNDIITSKAFIQAIARGVYKDVYEAETIFWIMYKLDRFNLIYKLRSEVHKVTNDEITTQQAFAIRDDELDIFIKKILWK